MRLAAGFRLFSAGIWLFAWPGSSHGQLEERELKGLENAMLVANISWAELRYERKPISDS
jgi:hypothetical protein